MLFTLESKASPWRNGGAERGAALHLVAVVLGECVHQVLSRAPALVVLQFLEAPLWATAKRQLKQQLGGADLGIREYTMQ